jgi:hypothetical protein
MTLSPHCRLQSIRRNKEFGNPYILTKVVEHFKIEQSGSNFPKGVFDPNELTVVSSFIPTISSISF